MPSIFTRIIAGQIPGNFIMRDPLWVAFLDIHPVEPGHVLLVPTQEVALMSELQSESLAALGPTLQRLDRALRSTLNCPAVSILLRDGAAAGQEVPHLHWHLIPRFPSSDAHQFHSGPAAAAADLAAMAQRIASAWISG